MMKNVWPPAPRRFRQILWSDFALGFWQVGIPWDRYSCPSAHQYIADDWERLTLRARLYGPWFHGQPRRLYQTVLSIQVVALHGSCLNLDESSVRPSLWGWMSILWLQSSLALP